MNLGRIINFLNLKPLTETYQDRDVKSAYVSDLLSDVMANTKPGEIWITLQVHVNIVAVATLKNIPAIIITNNREPDAETIKKASSEGVAIFKTNLSTFETAGRLYKLLTE